MTKPQANPATCVYGHVIPSPAVTLWGRWMLFTRIGLPVIALFFAFDIVIWAAGRWLFGVCAAIWCLL